MLNQDAIYIIGAGAIGMALAAFLKLEGKNVIILRGSIDDKSDYIDTISVELNSKEISASVRISTVSKFATLNGIVVLTNKSYGNQLLAERLKDKINYSPVVILQNGLNVEQPFIDRGFSQIYRCVLYTTSQVISQSKIRFKPVSASPVGIIKGSIENLETIIRELSNPYLEFISEANIQPIIWTKAIINSVFNSVCPLLETDNGIFFRNEKFLNIAKRVIAECIVVAKSKGILLDAEKLIAGLLQISKFSDGQMISTYQDIKNKRRTEIERLNFAIADVAKESGLEDFVKETRLLGELVKLKSEMAMINFR